MKYREKCVKDRDVEHYGVNPREPDFTGSTHGFTGPYAILLTSLRADFCFW